MNVLLCNELVIGFPEGDGMGGGGGGANAGLCKRVVQLPHLLGHYFPSNPPHCPRYLEHCNMLMDTICISMNPVKATSSNVT